MILIALIQEDEKVLFLLSSMFDVILDTIKYYLAVYWHIPVD